MSDRPFLSHMSGQRYATAAEAGEVAAIVVDGLVYNIEDLPRRIAQFHDLRDTTDALFRAVQRTML